MERMTNDTPYWKERLSAHDTISRQAAVEALYDWEMCYDWDEHCREEDPKPAYIISPSDVIEKLPSVQPDCSDCIEHGGDWDCDHVHCHKGKSAQPEQKKGKWIPIHDDIFADRYYCSCCKAEPICNDTEYILSNFCPNCGAKME